MDEKRQWISVKTRKPKKNVLVTLSHAKDRWVVAGTYGPRKQFWNQFMDSPKFYEPCYPTHWMPLPSPPELSES